MRRIVTLLLFATLPYLAYAAGTKISDGIDIGSLNKSTDKLPVGRAADNRATVTTPQAIVDSVLDSTHRFATDAEKATWNAKSPAFANATTLSRFGAGPTYNGSPIGSGSGGHTIQNAAGQNLTARTVFQCYSGLNCTDTGSKTRVELPLATTTAKGGMSAADKTKLDAVLLFVGSGDVTTSLQTYLNDHAGNKIVVSGDMTITGTITVPASTHLEADASNGATITRYTGDGNFFILGESVKFSGFGLYYQGASVSGKAFDVRGNWVKISDVYVENSVDGVVHNADYVGLKVDDFYFANHKGKAFDLHGNDHMISDGITFAVGNAGAIGLRLYNKNEAIMVSDVDFIGGDYNVYADAAVNSPVVRPGYNKFNGVYFDSAAIEAVHINNSVVFDFDSCWFSSRPSNAASVALTNASNINFTGGQFFNNGKTAVSIAATAKHIGFSGVDFLETNTSDSVAGYGIDIASGADDIRIVNSSFIDGQHGFNGKTREAIHGIPNHFSVADIYESLPSASYIFGQSYAAMKYDSSATTSNIVLLAGWNFTDSSTGSDAAKQLLRFDYTRAAGATSTSSGYDALINLKANVNESTTTHLNYLMIEGPTVASGKTLGNWNGLHFTAPSGAGTITNPNALLVDAGVTARFKSSIAADAGVTFGDASSQTTAFLTPTGSSSQTGAPVVMSGGRLYPHSGINWTFNVGGISTASDFGAANLTASNMTSSSVLFAGTGGLLSQDNINFKWNNAEKRLSINNPSPTAGYEAPLQVKANAGGYLWNIGNGTVESFAYMDANGTWMVNKTAHHLYLGTNDGWTVDLFGKFTGVNLGGAVASASTITPPAMLFHVTGTTTVNTINIPWTGYNGCIDIIPDGAFATGTSGNIAIATTAVVSKLIHYCYDATAAKWYPSY